MDVTNDEMARVKIKEVPKEEGDFLLLILLTNNQALSFISEFETSSQSAELFLSSVQISKSLHNSETRLHLQLHRQEKHFINSLYTSMTNNNKNKYSKFTCIPSVFVGCQCRVHHFSQLKKRRRVNFSIKVYIAIQTL